MIKRIVEFNVATGQETVTEIEMTAEEIAAEAEQIRKSEIERRLQEIRAELVATDWRAIKFAEGAMTAEEFEPYKVQRAALREEYNNLEAQLAA